MISTSTPAGNRNTHGNVVAEPVPSAISVPSDTSGGWIPKPRKLKPVSARIAVPTLSAVSMISSDATLGRMWRTMIRPLRTPMYRAATTNSRERRLIVIPRTMRELIIQLNSDSRTINQNTRSASLRRGVTIAIRMKLGTTSSTSTIHMSVRSRHPPKYPAIDPTVAAMIVEMNATHTPISMDFCMPRNTCARMSCPRAVVPNQCSGEGGCCSA